MSTIQPATDTFAGSGPRFLFGTPIGVDVGLNRLLTLAPAAASADVEEASVFHDLRVEAGFEELQRRFEQDGVLDEELADRVKRMLDEAARQALQHAQEYESPVLVLEDLSYPYRSLGECVASEANADCWIFPAVQRRLADRANTADIPVAVVSMKYTTRQCHVCQKLASVDEETISCPKEDCPVEGVCRDRSAAVSIAQRVL